MNGPTFARNLTWVKKSNITVSLDNLGWNIVELYKYYYYILRFLRNWVPAFNLNTSKLVPMLPGTNLGPVCVR